MEERWLRHEGEARQPAWQGRLPLAVPHRPGPRYHQAMPRPIAVLLTLGRKLNNGESGEMARALPLGEAA